MEDKICDYGCGQKANYEMSNGKLCCSSHYNKCPELRKKFSKNKLTKDEIFTKNSTLSNEFVKKKIIEFKLLPYKCDICEISKWNSKKIILELDHIDGNRFNNLLENLRLLCPNCHSQTKTYRGKNINGYQKVSDKDLKNALTEKPNIRQALIEVGLSPKGGNYERANKLLNKI